MNEQDALILDIGSTIITLLIGGEAFTLVRGAFITRTGNFVYRSVAVTGEVQYVGIANNLACRAAQHLRGKGIQIEKVMDGLSREDAKTVEQA